MAKYIDTTEALQRAKDAGVGISLVTLIQYCKPFPEGFEIGVKVGGRWRINPNKLKLLLEGKQWLLQERAEAEKLNPEV